MKWLWTARINLVKKFVILRILLLVFVRYLNDNSLRSDLLHSVNLSTTTRGDIHGQILDFFNLHELDFQELVGCCSDAAASMMGIHKEFVAKIRPFAPNCSIYTKHIVLISSLYFAM